MQTQFDNRFRMKDYTIEYVKMFKNEMGCESGSGRIGLPNIAKLANDSQLNVLKSLKANDMPTNKANSIISFKDQAKFNSPYSNKQK